MGCDIHMYAEVKKNNKWSKVGDVFENMWYSKDRELSDWNKPLTDTPYDGRNYDLFAILADVRNGHGFAGCVTGERFNPISEPKGLPDDVSKKIKKESDKWDGDGHSHSYFTVKELLDFQEIPFLFIMDTFTSMIKNWMKVNICLMTLKPIVQTYSRFLKTVISF